MRGDRLNKTTRTRRLLRFFTMLGGVMATGIILAIMSALFGSFITMYSGGEFAGLAAVLGGLMVGYPLGVSCCVVIFDKILRFEGEMWTGVAGGIITAVMAVVLHEPLGLYQNPGVMVGVFFFTTPLVATLLFHWKTILAAR